MVSGDETSIPNMHAHTMLHVEALDGAVQPYTSDYFLKNSLGLGWKAYGVWRRDKHTQHACTHHVTCRSSRWCSAALHHYGLLIKVPHSTGGNHGYFEG